jgi:hypothetical protein
MSAPEIVLALVFASHRQHPPAPDQRHPTSNPEHQSSNQEHKSSIQEHEKSKQKHKTSKQKSKPAKPKQLKEADQPSQSYKKLPAARCTSQQFDDSSNQRHC